MQNGSWSIPLAAGDWSKIEWRYYESHAWDDVSMIKEDMRQFTMFYTNEMPKNGWEEMGWMKTPEANWCSYSKNNGQDGAMVWVSSEGDKAIFALMRATK